MIKNKRVLITGASSGIGRALAEKFASHNNDLVLVARRADRLEELAAFVEAKFGIKASVVSCDLSSLDNVNNLITYLEDNNLSIDILVNNAGLGLGGVFADSDKKQLESMLMVNVVALTMLTRHLLPLMRERGDGAILNIASIAAFLPIPLLSVYAATKAYVLSFTEALWKELGREPIHVTAICPGPVATEFFDIANMDIKSSRQLAIQQPDDVAEIAYVALCNNKRSVITSCRLKIANLLFRFLPRSWVLTITMKMNQDALKD